MDKKIAFIGGGMIGAGLATNAALHGFRVVIQTRTPAKMGSVYGRVQDALQAMEDNGMLTPEQVKEAYGRVTVTNSIADAAKDAVFVQESVAENLEVKRDTIAQIEAVCPKDTVIASATSTISATKLQEGAQDPGRILIGHPFNPAYLLPLVEVCVGEQTAEETVQKACEIYSAMGKEPIVCRKDLPGFLVNRISRAVLADARSTVISGACTAEDYDKALIYGPGMRMAITGQLLTIDLGTEGGLKNNAAKYGRALEPSELLVAESVDEEIKNRDSSIGNTREDICKWRDKMIIDILRLHGKLP